MGQTRFLASPIGVAFIGRVPDPDPGEKAVATSQEDCVTRMTRSVAYLILFLVATLAARAAGAAEAQRLRPVTPGEPEGAALVERLREGGLVLYFRHADTTGMACDRTYRIGDRSGQRNLSAAGREQSQRIGAAFRQERIPLALPVLSSPVFRARDTAELAFGAAQVEVTDSLLADDYAGRRLEWVIEEHRRLVATAPPPKRNVVLIGHRGPIVMALGAYVGGDSLPEGAALVIDPSSGTARVLGVLVLAPLAEPGRETC